MSIPNRAYLVTSGENPVFALVGTVVSDSIKVRSIHLCPREAADAVRVLRNDVFARLSRDHGGSEEYITNLLEYRETIKVVVCRLDAIEDAEIE